MKSDVAASAAVAVVAMFIVGLIIFVIIRTPSPGSKGAEKARIAEPSADARNVQFADSAGADDGSTIPVVDSSDIDRASTAGGIPDAIVVLYKSSGCHHCVAMQPQWQELKDNAPRGVECQEIDSSDVESVQRAGVRGFPTIMMYYSDGRDPVVYSGNRSTESLLRFASSRGEEEVA